VKKILAMLFVATLAVLLVYVAALLPPMGDAGNPTNTQVVPRYLERGEEEAGTKNIVASIVFNYRGYDTMGEVAIFSAALAGIFAVLGMGRRKIGRAVIDDSPVKFSFVSGTAAVLLIPLMIVFSLYIIIYGLDLPGGGFQGGATIGAAAVLFTAAFGFLRAQERIPHHARIILESTAIVAFFLVGTAGVVGGGSFLTYMLPSLPAGIQATARTVMLFVLQFGIGIKVGVICASILFALLREEETEDVAHAG
jgi:multicomponent Na+:H+ antiporter subunit B